MNPGRVVPYNSLCGRYSLDAYSCETCALSNYDMLYNEFADVLTDTTI